MRKLLSQLGRNSILGNFLTIFGKVTVIKTMCLPKLNHIAVVVPSPSCILVKALESESTQFISWNNPSVVDDNTRKMPIKEGRFGIPRVNLFWKAIRMSWLRRSAESDSTWLRLHKQEVYPHAFDPYKSNFESLSKAKSICKNPFWKDVYSLLIDCN